MTSPPFGAVAPTRHARVHFWLHNLGFLVFTGALALQFVTQTELAIVIAAGATALLAGLVAFAADLLLNVRAPR